MANCSFNRGYPVRFPIGFPLDPHQHIGVSIYGGWPKWMVYKGKSYSKRWSGTTPIVGNLRIFVTGDFPLFEQASVFQRHICPSAPADAIQGLGLGGQRDIWGWAKNWGRWWNACVLPIKHVVWMIFLGVLIGFWVVLIDFAWFWLVLTCEGVYIDHARNPVKSCGIAEGRSWCHFYGYTQLCYKLIKCWDTGALKLWLLTQSK